MSTAAYNLLHDGPGNSRIVSILTQLKIKKSLNFTSSARSTASTMIPYAPLILMHFGNNGPPMFLAEFESTGTFLTKNLLQFSDWYSEKIYKNQRGAFLTRQNLIFSMRCDAMRCQDGGSHFEPTVKQTAYLSLRTNVDDRMTASYGGQQVQIKYAHTATMRQIAAEILDTIEDATPPEP